MTEFLIILMILVIMLMMTCVKIVSKNEVYIIERLGKYYATWRTGVHFKMPFIDRVTKRLTTSNVVKEISCANMETYDHEFINIEVSAFLKISDYHKYAYSQAENQFENLIHDELSDIILKCPVDKIGENFQKIEYNLFRRIEESPIMKNVGLTCQKLSIRKGKETNF